MEEFKIIMQIMYEEDKYLVLLNSKRQKYFLRILDDEKFMYPTMEEFTKLYNIFANDKIKQKCYQKDFQAAALYPRRYKIRTNPLQGSLCYRSYQGT